jgi:hypothetical protein
MIDKRKYMARIYDPMPITGKDVLGALGIDKTFVSDMKKTSHHPRGGVGK